MKNMRLLKPETSRFVALQKSSKMEVEEGYAVSYLSLSKIRADIKGPLK